MLRQFPAISKVSSDLKPWVDLTRVRKFSGIMVWFWPFAWGLTMAARSILLPLREFNTILTAGFFGACAGCIWNDILDKDIDCHVERTKSRPIASGKISVKNALIFLGLHLTILVYITWHVNQLAWIISLITIFPLPGIYPLMKRITHWPQAWLGIAANTGIILAWAITTNSLPKSAWVLSAAAWCWTMWYDTIYACQDKKDDVKVGVKSTAVLFGSHVKNALMLFGTVMISGLVLAGIMNHQSLPFFIVEILGGASHLGWQLYSMDPNSPRSCWDMFQSNAFYLGGIVEVGLFLDYVMRSYHYA